MAVNDVSILDDYKKKNQNNGASGTTAPKSTAPVGIGYDKNTDYSLAIQDAVNRGDLYSAAQLEQQRNAKIDGEGITAYQKTNQYSAYLPGGSAYAAGATGEKYTYENPYQSEIERLLGELNGAQFTYDPNNAQAEALRQRYTEAGQQAMENTLAQVSARTGGLASSYAGAAAQQQYNNYMQGLDDSLAALEQQAYQNWLTEQDAKRANLQLMASLGAQGENSYWNALNYDTALRQYQDDMVYRNWEQAMTEKQYQDSLTAADKQYAYDTVMGILQTGNMPSADLLTASGISSDDAQLLANYYKQQMMQAAYSGRSGGSSGRSSGGSSKASGSPDYDALFSAAKASGYPESYIENNYKKYGFSSKNGLYDEYVDVWEPENEVNMNRVNQYYNNIVDAHEPGIDKGSSDYVPMMIMKYNEQGYLNAAEVRELFRMFGLDPNDYGA